MERIRCIGVKKSQGLLGFHEFKGSDWGGKLVGITTERWSKIYIDELSEDDPVVRCFAYLGSYPPECFVLDDGICPKFTATI